MSEQVPYDQQPYMAKDFSLWRETGGAILSGAENAARSTYNFLDTLTFDLLPDANWEPIFDAPETVGGSFVAGAAQFFLPYAGLTGGLMAFSGKATKTGKVFNWLSGGGAFEKGRAVGKGEMGLIKGILKGETENILTGTIKGSVVDFVAFDGRADRISNLLQNAGVDNNLVNWLAADEDDGVIEARFKETIEGGILGTAFDTTLAFLRGGRAYYKARKAGKPEDVARAEGIKVQNEYHDELIEERAAARDELLDSQADEPLVAFEDSELLQDFDRALAEQERKYRLEYDPRTPFEPDPGYLESPAIRDLVERTDDSLSEDGKPLLWYHGSRATKLTDGELKPTTGFGRFPTGLVWLADNKRVAEKNGTSVTPVFADAQNVLRWDDEDTMKTLVELSGTSARAGDPHWFLQEKQLKTIMDLGYDAVMTPSNEGSGMTLVLLNGRSQARSAFGRKEALGFEGNALAPREYVTGADLDKLAEEGVRHSLTLGKSLEGFGDILEDVERRKGYPTVTNPKDPGYSAEDLAIRDVKRRGTNLTQAAVADPELPNRIARAFEKVWDSTRKTYVPNTDLFAKDLETLKEIGVMDHDGFNQFLSNIPALAKENEEAINAAASFSRVMVTMWQQAAEKFHPKMFEMWTRPDLTPAQARHLAQMAMAVEAPLAAAHRIRGAFGRNFQTFSRDPWEWLKKVDPEAPEIESLTPIQKLAALKDDALAEDYMPLIEDMKNLMQSGNITDDMKALRQWNSLPMGKRITKAVVEARTMGLLANGSTLAVSASSILGMGFWRPIEKTIGSLVGNVVLSDPAARAAQRSIMRKEIGTIQSFIANFTETWKIIDQTGGWKGLDNHPFNSDSLLEGQHFNSVELGLRSMKLPEAPSRFTGKLINAPGVALQKGDSMGKLLFGRAKMESELRERLLDMGHDPALMEGKIRSMLDKTLRSRGDIRKQLSAELAIRRDADALAQKEGFAEIVSPKDHDYITELNLEDSQVEAWLESIDSSQKFGTEIAFTNKPTGLGTDTEQGFIRSIGAHIQRVLEEHPMGKFFTPFVRTPTNIAEYSFDRTIGGVLGAVAEATRRTWNTFGGNWELTTNASFKVQRQLASGDPELINEALTGMTVGLGVVGSALYLASQKDEDTDLPVWTGRGPSNPDERKALMARGWQPYSVKIGDKYVSYQRLDPIGTIMGVIVDSSDYLGEHSDGSLAGDAFMAMTYAPAIAIASNISNKTYMKGIADTLKLVLEPERYAESYLQSNAATFLPFSGLGGGINRSIDDTFREVRGFQDALWNRIPGQSDRLPVKRNILGEAVKREYNKLDTVNFMRITSISDDVVNEEIGKLAYGFSMPGTTKGHLDLLDERFDMGGRAAYDTWIERSGKIKINGMTVRQAIRKLIKSNDYQALDPNPGPNGETSMRVGAINSLLFKYRDRAWREILRENQTLSSAYRQVEVNTKRRREGRPTLRANY